MQQEKLSMHGRPVQNLLYALVILQRTVLRLTNTWNLDSDLLGQKRKEKTCSCAIPIVNLSNKPQAKSRTQSQQWQAKKAWQEVGVYYRVYYHWYHTSFTQAVCLVYLTWLCLEFNHSHLVIFPISASINSTSCILLPGNPWLEYPDQESSEV